MNVVIPRSGSYGVGNVFLEYADLESSIKAHQELNGRKFCGNQVVAVFYSVNKFYQESYGSFFDCSCFFKYLKECFLKKNYF